MHCKNNFFSIKDVLNVFHTNNRFIRRPLRILNYTNNEEFHSNYDYLLSYAKKNEIKHLQYDNRNILESKDIIRMDSFFSLLNKMEESKSCLLNNIKNKLIYLFMKDKEYLFKQQAFLLFLRDFTSLKSSFGVKSYMFLIKNLDLKEMGEHYQELFELLFREARKFNISIILLSITKEKYNVVSPLLKEFEINACRLKGVENVN